MQCIEEITGAFVKAGGAVAGGLAGGAIGGGIGSCFGPVGALVGFVVGTIIGNYAGHFIGGVINEKIWGMFKKCPAEAIKKELLKNAFTALGLPTQADND